MKPIPFFLCSLFLPFALEAESPHKAGASAETPLSLSAITDVVLANNPDIKEARAHWEAMRQRLPQAAAWDDLKVGGSTRLARFVDVAANSFTDQMVSVEQMIPISGRNRSRERIAAAEALATLEDLHRKQLDAVAKARTAYFRLVRDYALLELNRENESSLTQTVEISRARLEVGNQGQADVLVAENEVNRLEEDRHDLMQSVSEDETQLNVLMNRDAFVPLGKPVSMPQPGTERLSVERCRASVLRTRPEVRSAEAQVTASLARLELAKREWIPDPAISIEAQRYNGAAQGVSEVAAGVSFNVPWLNVKKYRAGEREAQSGVEATQRALESARSTALGLIRDQFQKIETARHHIELYQTRLIPNARQTVQTDRTNYEGGKTGFLELILSERSLRELEAMLQQHLADYQIAAAELDALIGSPLPRSPSTGSFSKGGAK
ncbi:MAG TPA: TolC family protein [Chthoniobacter sp.]|jgi:outer membrane protein TolC